MRRWPQRWRSSRSDRPRGLAPLTAALTATALLVACDGYERSFALGGADAGRPPPFELAPLDLESRTAARWWSLPDGGAQESEYYPCNECHDEDWDTNTKVRSLEEDHDELTFDHGAGRIWCMGCHHLTERGSFTDGAGRPLPAERPDRACATCHALQYGDFLHGVHGKRVGTYAGERVLTPCIACHDPHAPAIAPRMPQPPPRSNGHGRPPR